MLQSTKKYNYSNVILNAYSFLFLASYTERTGYLAKNQTFFYLYNSITFTTYKKNLNKDSLLFIYNNKQAADRGIKSLGICKKHVNFSKLTWYWAFKAISQNRFLLNYKEYKNHFSKNYFVKYELDLLNYEKKYNKWNSHMNIYIKNTENLNQLRKDKNKFKFYIFRLKADRSIKESYYYINRKIKRSTNPELKNNDDFLKGYRKPRTPILYKFKVFKKFWRTKKYRILGLKKWVASVKIRANFESKKRSVYILNKSLTNSLSNLNFSRNSLQKSLWKLKSSKNKYFKSLSLNLNRQNLLNNVPLLRNKTLRAKLFYKNKKNPVKNLLTNFIYPKNSIDLEDKKSFNCIIFKNSYKESNRNVNLENTELFRTKNLVFESTRRTSFIKYLSFKKNFIKFENKSSRRDFKSGEKPDKIILNFSKKKIVLKQRSNLFKKKNGVENFKVTSLRLLKKNLKTKNHHAFVAKNYKIVKLFKKSQIFVKFIYSSVIYLKTNLNLYLSKLSIFRFTLNRKKLNQVVTNIFMHNFLVKQFFNVLKIKIRSNLDKGLRSNLLNYIFKLNNYNAKVCKRLKKNYEKKKNKKKQAIKIRKNEFFLKKNKNRLNFEKIVEDKLRRTFLKINYKKEQAFCNKTKKWHRIRLNKSLIKMRYWKFLKYAKKSMHNIFLAKKQPKSKNGKKRLIMSKSLQERSMLLTITWKKSSSKIFKTIAHSDTRNYQEIAKFVQEYKFNKLLSKNLKNPSMSKKIIINFFKSNYKNKNSFNISDILKTSNIAYLKYNKLNYGRLGLLSKRIVRRGEGTGSLKTKWNLLKTKQNNLVKKNKKNKSKIRELFSIVSIKIQKLRLKKRIKKILKIKYFYNIKHKKNKKDSFSKKNNKYNKNRFLNSFFKTSSKDKNFLNKKITKKKVIKQKNRGLRVSAFGKKKIKKITNKFENFFILLNLLKNTNNITTRRSRNKRRHQNIFAYKLYKSINRNKKLRKLNKKFIIKKNPIEFHRILKKNKFLKKNSISFIRVSGKKVKIFLKRTSKFLFKFKKLGYPLRKNNSHYPMYCSEFSNIENVLAIPDENKDLKSLKFKLKKYKLILKKKTRKLTNAAVRIQILEEAAANRSAVILNTFSPTSKLLLKRVNSTAKVFNKNYLIKKIIHNKFKKNTMFKSQIIIKKNKLNLKSITLDLQKNYVFSKYVIKHKKENKVKLYYFGKNKRISFTKKNLKRIFYKKLVKVSKTTPISQKPLYEYPQKNMVLKKNLLFLSFFKINKVGAEISRIEKFKPNVERLANNNFSVKSNYLLKNKNVKKLANLNPTFLNKTGSLVYEEIFNFKKIQNTKTRAYKPSVINIRSFSWLGGLVSVFDKLAKIKNKKIIKKVLNKKVNFKNKNKKLIVNKYLNIKKNHFLKKKFNYFFNWNYLLNSKDIFRYRTDFLKIKKNIYIKKNKNNSRKMSLSFVKFNNVDMYFFSLSDKNKTKKVSKAKRFNFLGKKIIYTNLLKKKVKYFQKIKGYTSRLFNFFKKKKITKMWNWNVGKKLKKIKNLQFKPLNKKNTRKKSIKQAPKSTILNLNSKLFKKLNENETPLRSEFLKLIKNTKIKNQKSKIRNFKLKKINKRKRLVIKKRLGRVKNIILKKFEQNKGKLLLKKNYKFLGARFLKYSTLRKRNKLKRGLVVFKKILKKNTNNYKLRWKTKLLFWKNIKKNFEFPLFSNRQLWVRKNTTWAKYNRKLSYDKKIKNILTVNRWREYGKRQYPRGWYKIRRRKFPLKSQKKKWALKITKHYNLLYWKVLKRQTTYDSSYTYYRYLSVRSALSKKLKRNLFRKLGYRLENLLYFPYKFQPKFKYNFSIRKRKILGSWDMSKNYNYKKEVFSTTAGSRRMLKSFYNPTAAFIRNKKYRFSRKLAYSQYANHYAKAWGIYLARKYKMYSIFLTSWQNKLTTFLDTNGLKSFKLKETVKLKYNNDLEKTLSTCKSKKFNYLSKITTYANKLPKYLLINSLTKTHFELTTRRFAYTYNLTTRYRLKKSRKFGFNLFLELRSCINKTKYVSLKPEITSVDVVSTRLKTFFKVYKTYLKTNTKFERTGSIKALQKNYNFINISKKKNMKFINNLPVFFKKNYWIFNSFEVTSGAMVGFNNIV